MQPENQEKWSAATKDTLNGAKAATQDMLNQIQAENEAHEKMLADKHHAWQEERIRISLLGGSRTNPNKQKQKDAIRHAAMARLESLDNTITEAGRCAHNLLHGRQAKWAALKVCEWRLELRESRPVPERFRDNVHAALESERDVLNEARKQLNDHANVVKAVLNDMYVVKHRLVNSMVEKHAALPSQAVMQEPASPDGSPQKPPEEKTVDVPALIKQAIGFEANSAAVCKKGAEVIKKTVRDCAIATEKTEAQLKKKATELNEMINKLRQQILEMSETLNAADKNLNLTIQKLELKTGDEATLKAKLEKTTGLCEKLLAAKKAAEDDLRCKVVNMKIEDACIKILPEKTETKPGKLIGPTVVAAEKMSKSASTGSISQPGGSNALKAAATLLGGTNSPSSTMQAA